MHTSAYQCGDADTDEAPHLFYKRLVGLSGAGGSPPAQPRSQAAGPLYSDTANELESSEWARGKEHWPTALPGSTHIQYDAPHGQPLEPETALEQSAGAKCHGAISILPGKGRAPAKAGHSVQQSGYGQLQANRICVNSIGYQMLRKAGWREGSGLGAQEQGRQQPILPEYQPGKRGVGAASMPTTQAAPEGLAPAAAAAKPAQVPRPARMPLPEDVESFDTRIKRHRQVMQTDVDDTAGRQISRFLYSAFRDGAGESNSKDSNPLLRRNKLSSSNPLL